ncbi:MAG TPA: hypothetical protein VEG39_11845 [Clostridia bacterium]|nr:hypothetical protein [Clostridia bacterium]
MNENQYGVLLESILDKVNAIAEGQRNIEKNLNDFKDETVQKLDKVENRLGKVEDRLDKVENRLGSMEKEIKAVKTYVVGIDDTINQHEKRIQGVEKNVI